MSSKNCAFCERLFHQRRTNGEIEECDRKRMDGTVEVRR